MRLRSGSALILVVSLCAVLMTLAVILTKMVYNTYTTAVLIEQREAAFWLAEAGLEAGKVKLARNPGWYTDLQHYPEDDVRWLKAGAVGEGGSLPSGTFVIVREKDQARLYSIGSRGRVRVILKIEFTTAPYETQSQTEL
ncbi:hypothetical protein A2625_03815 [candidate division WOR-1 bacterium RIFCSPHIGHO2_01_FULL_53_15]|uniref:Type 4 fimbrial biogenesis protein PilX N-terminal domain-containing protein n=1 Tax=candidate division WOR-1 bacterium RIFCSPHIGHO2_01_FULL_53_15 TaxID=1802564 RepID=A0A1F4Q000_UNCSA|nr:MAG: hypothetical protein A2625_03815 [candidate division WOR-1 bacterium RIFCSPHIGHO2_01_FULL_53_15]OGC12897.1 MAG: hypothetical protein A3D23_04850 [candidate division WOR-1 bacterium RIFCSPHIGHO2_02_FULL_53_26]